MILLLILGGLLIYYLFLLQQRYQYFSQRNIPTPPFEFLFGHIRTLWNARLYSRQLENWTKQYGKIYGLYEGTIPVFVTSDVDFLQEVFIKQFSVFSARRPTLLDGFVSNLFSAIGPTWRRQRHLINPSFTTAKLKTMSPLINGCISDVMKKLSDHAENGEQFDIYLYYKRMTMDVICRHTFLFYSSNDIKHVVCWHILGRCAFGIDTDLQNTPNNIYFQKIKELFDDNFFDKGFLLKAAQVVPEIGVVLRPLFSITTNTLTFINTRLLPLISPNKQLNEMPIIWLIKRLHTIVEQRQRNPISRADLLQLMLQSATNDPVQVNLKINDQTIWRLSNFRIQQITTKPTIN